MGAMALRSNGHRATRQRLVRGGGLGTVKPLAWRSGLALRLGVAMGGDRPHIPGMRSLTLPQISLTLLGLLLAFTTGATPMHPPELAARLAEALAVQGADYRPRTEHFNADGAPKYTNRLILEPSPYLHQHAHNPVDWYPWGEEALAKARAENRPILVSIGYATCHWCHVMERESFEDESVAALLNAYFVPIKVDREQRPDLDAAYMAASLLQNGSGGWPLNVLLTPEGEPFFSGTYFPRDNFIALLNRAQEIWRSDEAGLRSQAHDLAAGIRRMHAARHGAAALPKEAAQSAAAAIIGQYDEFEGGFGQAPKFPHEGHLLLLLDQAERHGDRMAREAALGTLRAMARGGIHDQVGGGFARYSTDNSWLVPHFEKMLYNQALLARAYLHAYRLSGEASLARVVRRTLDYTLREMQAPEGGFYSATDADSEGREGAFFVWREEALDTVLDEEEMQLARAIFEIRPHGNFEGDTILHLPRPLAEVAKAQGSDEATLTTRLDTLLDKLYTERERRIHPLRDDKQLTAWNGMLITALAEAGWWLHEPRYLDAARHAADFLWRHNRHREGQLYRAHLNGGSSTPATAEDYAYLGEGLVALYDADGDPAWLARARELADALIARFADPDHGGLYMSENSDLGGFTRLIESHDGAIPSGNSVGLRLFTRLARRTGEPRYREAAERLLGAFAAQIAQQPSAYSYMLLAAEELRAGEVGPLAYSANGALRLELRRAEGGAVRIRLSLREGWHCNAAEVNDPELVPTRIEGEGGWQLDGVGYPPGERVALGSAEPVALYQGDLVLVATPRWVGEGRRGPLHIVVAVQLCGSGLCLAPERITLQLP